MLNRWPREGTKTTRITSCPLSERLATKADGNCPHIDPINQFASSSTLSATSKSRKLLKRPRSAEGIDGDDEVLQRKKRRLRLELVTSRLSRPYADPATHIGGTSAWRAGAWSRQRFAGGKLLRKAAILNSIAKRRKGELLISMKTGERRMEHRTPTPHPNAFGNGSPQRALAGSGAPFVPSDYDVFDYEGDHIISGEEEEEEEEDEDTDRSDEDSQAIHSDFHSLEPSETDPEFFDTSWSFVCTGDPEIDPSGTEIKLVMENERKDEVSIAPASFEGLPSNANLPAARI